MGLRDIQLCARLSGVRVSGGWEEGERIDFDSC